MLQTGVEGVSGHECVAGRRHHLTEEGRGREIEIAESEGEREGGREIVLPMNVIK